MAKIRPNKQNLAIKEEWFRKAGGGIVQFILQLLRMQYPGMTNNFKLTLIAILDRIRPKGQGGAFPTLECIAEDANVSRETVKRAILYWRTHGILEWTTKHGLHSNEYTLLKSPLDLRINITVQADGQRLKMSLAKGSKCSFEQAQNEPLSHTKGSQTRVTTAERGSADTGDGGTDGGTDQAERATNPHCGTPLPSLDKNRLALLDGPQDASDGVGTALTTPQAVLTRLAGSCEAAEAVTEGSGSYLEDPMSWRQGGYSAGKPSGPEKAMDRIPVNQADLDADAEETERKKPKKPIKQAIVVWSKLRERAKDKGMDIPMIATWDARAVQELIDTEGYGMEKVLEMALALVDHWQNIKAQFKLRMDLPNVYVLTRWASDLRNAKTSFLGKGANWASPDIKEAAEADAAIRRAEYAAKKAKVAGGMA